MASTIILQSNFSNNYRDMATAKIYIRKHYIYASLHQFLHISSLASQQITCIYQLETSNSIFLETMKTLVLIFFFLLSYLHTSYSQKYNAIYSFGDSVSDTGNLCVSGRPSSLTLAQPPYGETYFGKVTCRCSDGRLVVDFLGNVILILSSTRLSVRIFACALSWL